MRSERTGAGFEQSEGADGSGTDIAGQFRAVLIAEEHFLASVSRAGDFRHWQVRVVREVMDHGSPYALALRRGQGASRQSEFLRCWQALIAEALQRVVPQRDDCAYRAPSAKGSTAGGPERLAVAVLAALHGGAILSWLGEDGISLEFALDVALAPVMALQGPKAAEHQWCD